MTFYVRSVPQFLLILALFVLAGCMTPNQRPEGLPCRKEVTLAGTIVQKIFPGPPNYESVQKGDAPENYWILVLNEPVNVDKDPNYPAPGEDKKLTDVREVQLQLDYDAYRKYLNQKVVVAGSLWHGFTVHHKTTVLIDVKQMEAEK